MEQQQVSGEAVVQILLNHPNELVQTATQNAILQVQNYALMEMLQNPQTSGEGLSLVPPLEGRGETDDEGEPDGPDSA